MTTITIGPGISVGPGIFINARETTASGTISYTTAGTYTVSIPTGLVLKSITMLLIGGGGGGGDSPNAGGGGGGAGGVVANVNLLGSVTPGQTYTVTVGSGGATTAPGSNSTAFGYVALGGGGGGPSATKNGGSGGGGDASTPNRAGGSTIQYSTYGYGVGYNGSASGPSSNYGGGGGGAGGTSGSYTPGPGIYDSITGTSTYYAEGGPGGSGTPGITPSTAPGSGGRGFWTNGFSPVAATAGKDGAFVIKYTYAVYTS